MANTADFANVMRTTMVQVTTEVTSKQTEQIMGQFSGQITDLVVRLGTLEMKLDSIQMAMENKGVGKKPKTAVTKEEAVKTKVNKAQTIPTWFKTKYNDPNSDFKTKYALSDEDKKSLESTDAYIKAKPDTKVNLEIKSILTKLKTNNKIEYEALVAIYTADSNSIAEQQQPDNTGEEEDNTTAALTTVADAAPAPTPKKTTTAAKKTTVAAKKTATAAPAAKQ